MSVACVELFELMQINNLNSHLNAEKVADFVVVLQADWTNAKAIYFFFFF